MARLKIPYLKLRDGRPRWEPGPGLRALGLSGRDLKYPDGRWMSEGDALQAARALNAEAAARRAGGGKPRTGIPGKVARSVEALWEDYRASARFKILRPSTQADYKQKAGVFLDAFGASPVAALTPEIMQGWWEDMYRARGHAMANAVLAVARLVLAHGRRKSWLRDNPARDLALPAVAPRVSIWDPAELVLMVQCADQTGAYSVADAMILALHQGQREGDVLALPVSIAETGRCNVQQSKTETLVAAKLTPVAHARALAARARNYPDGVPTAGALIVNEQSGRPYRGRNDFGRRFRAVRREAAARLIMAGEEAAAWRLLHKTFQDLRDTYLTRSHRAGNDAKRRAAVSGHSERTQIENERHYIAVDEALADEAQDAYVAWMESQGIAL